MADHMMRRAALTAATLMAAIPCATPTRAQEAGSFIDSYIAAQGGCTGYTTFLHYERGMNNRSAPFGKAAKKWTEDDFVALRRSIDACITNPTARSLSEEQRILSVTRQRVEAAQAAYDVRQKQELASQAEYRSHRQERLEAMPPAS